MSIAKVIIKSGRKVTLKTPGPQGPAGVSSGGDVVGPSSTVSDNLATFSGTTGKLVSDSGASVATVRDRATHTGTQAISTISSLQTELNSKESGGTAATLIAAHAAASDPHPAYTTAAEATAAAPVQSVAGRTGAVTLVKADVGLGSVDNTADTAKPVSTAQQTALNLKAELASPAITGTPSAPTAAADTNTTQLATTAFVQQEIANDTTKAATSHTHTIADVTNLQTTLNGKAETSHTHTTAEVSFSATSVVLGRKTGGAGAGEEMTGADIKSLLTISEVPSGGLLGAYLGHNGTTHEWIHPTTHQYLWDHFEGAMVSPYSFAWQTIGSGGSIGQKAAETGAQGILSVDTGAGSTTPRGVNRGGESMLFGNGKIVMEWRVRIPTISTSGEKFAVRVGLHDGTSTTVPRDGAWFECDESVNSGQWQIKTANNQTSPPTNCTTTNTAVAPVANTWQKLRIEVNAAGTSVEFFINGTSVGTITTDIPTGTGRGTTAAMLIVKSVGTTGRSVDADYALIYQKFNTAL